LAQLDGGQTSTRTIRLLDVGSGAGLPGVVIAACCPSLQITCIDAVGKKAAFVRQVAAELGLPNLQALHGRVESLDKQAGACRFEVITSRAFSSLPNLVTLTERVLAHDGFWLAMKGRVPAEEISALSPTVEVFHVEQLTVPTLDAERCIVWLRKKDPAPPGS
ncbi:MAG: 16S rRNA (guanine(527)-N(7))-methyltransferase RsmG, partial [Burkholderiales bacterium]